MPDAPTVTETTQTATPAQADAPAVDETLDFDAQVNALEAQFRKESREQDSTSAEAADEKEPEARDDGADGAGSEPADSPVASAPAELTELEAQAKRERERRRADRQGSESLAAQQAAFQRQQQAFEAQQQEATQAHEQAERIVNTWDNEREVFRRAAFLARRKGLDADHLSQLWVDVQDPHAVAADEAHRASSQAMQPLEARVKQLEQELAQSRARATYQERVTGASQLAQKHAAEVPYLARIAAKRPEAFASMVGARLAEGASSQEVLLSIEEELREAAGLLVDDSGAASVKAAGGNQRAHRDGQNGSVSPKTLTNRAATERTSLLEPEDSELPEDEQIRVLERKLRNLR